jgi:hypothetical protein
MNKSIAALTLATLSFGSASAYLLGELRTERAQAQSLQAQIDELQRARPAQRNPFDRPPPPAVADDVTPPAPSPEPERPRPAQPPQLAEAAAVEPPVFTARSARMDRARELLQDPEYRKAMLAQQKFAMRRLYPDLQSALRLQPQEAEQLMDLLAEQQLNQMANSPPFRGRGGQMDPTEMQQYQQQLQQQQRERDAQIASVLGDSKLQEWQNYQQTLGARSQIRELRTELAEAGIPLREGQIEPLVASLAAEQQWRAQESMKYRGGQLLASGNATSVNRVAMMEQNLETTAEYNRRLHDAAAPYLSSDQLRRFDAHLSQQLEMQRANLQLMRAQQEAVSRGDIPAPEATFFRSQAVPGSTIVSTEAVALPLR